MVVQGETLRRPFPFPPPESCVESLLLDIGTMLTSKVVDGRFAAENEKPVLLDDIE